MENNSDIIEILNEVLTGELTAVNQYFIHAKMCKDWGFDKLHDHSREESIDEMKHAETLIERILYFDAVPNLQRLSPLRVGETVREQFENDLVTEKEAVERLNRGVALAASTGDNGTRSMLEDILTHEEEHVDWLETQLWAMDTLGETAYLAEQMG